MEVAVYFINLRIGAMRRSSKQHARAMMETCSFTACSDNFGIGVIVFCDQKVLQDVNNSTVL